MAKPVPCEVGMQIPHRDCTEVSEEVVVRKTEKAGRPDFEGIVSTERSRSDRRSRDAGSCAHVPVDSAEVQRGVRDRILEGQERGEDSPPVRREAIAWHAFLGGRLLCKYRGPG